MHREMIRVENALEEGLTYHHMSSFLFSVMMLTGVTGRGCFKLASEC